jgi:cytochrome c-type biogenesis protein CcmE
LQSAIELFHNMAQEGYVLSGVMVKKQSSITIGFISTDLETLISIEYARTMP